jgi:hypothetical protein
LKSNDDNYVKTKKETIKKLAEDLEAQGMQIGLIANEIVHSLIDCNVSRTYILDCLDKKYKREYKKQQEEEKEEKTEAQLSEIPKSIEDKKVIEESHSMIQVAATGEQEVQGPSKEDLEQMFKDESSNSSENIGKNVTEDKKLSPVTPPTATVQVPTEPNIFNSLKEKYEKEIANIKSEANKYLNMLNEEVQIKKRLDNDNIDLITKNKELQFKILRLEENEKEKEKEREIENEKETGKGMDEIILSRAVLETLYYKAIPERLKDDDNTMKFKLIIINRDLGKERFSLASI